MTGRSGYRTALLLLLLAALALRLVLVLRGGQRYFPDENRYLRCFILMRHLARGELGRGADYILQNPDHTGFILVGLVPALAHHGLLKAAGQPVTKESLDETLWIPAAVLSVCSVACVALVHAIARRAGAEEAEALAAALLMASAATMTYVARHLLPYDASMALALFALWVGLRPQPGPGRSVLVGLIAGAAFLTYNGYWLIALTAVAVHSVWGVTGVRDVVGRGAAAAAGLAALPVALTLASLMRGLGPYLRKMARFSRGAATQTDFHEGWSLPWAYLWHAEHGLLVVFAAAAVGLGVWRKREPATAARGLRWLATAAALYLVMVLLSDGLERIGTFGRLARQLVPLLCLATAAGAAVLSSSPAGRKVLAGGALVVAVQAGFNLAPPLAQRFPREVEREVTAIHGPVSRSDTVVSGHDDDLLVPGSRFVLLNARYLFPVRGIKPPPPGRTLYATPHPVQYLPYQYEGYVPEERALLREHDVSMRLIDTGSPATAASGVLPSRAPGRSRPGEAIP